MPKPRCDWLGLVVCREALGISPPSVLELPAISGAEAVRYLAREGLLTEVDPDSAVLPLVSGGRAELRAAQIRHGGRAEESDPNGSSESAARAAALARRICEPVPFRWGDVLEFARVLRMAGLASGPTAEPGVGCEGQVATAVALAHLIDPSIPDQSAAATRRARQLLRAKCRGPRAVEAIRLTGRALRSGTAATAVRWSIQPDPGLADLVEQAVAGRFDRTAFQSLDRALSRDALGPEERCVLPVIAPLLDTELPGHPMAKLVVGFARRQQFNFRAAEALQAALERGFASRGIPAMALGGTATGRRWYPEPGARSVAGSRLLAPAATRPGVVRRIVAEAAGELAGEVTGRHQQTLAKYGVDIAVGIDVAPPFAFPSAQRRVWRGAERASVPGVLEAGDPVLLYLSVVDSMLGAPAIRWFTDAARLRLQLGSDELFARTFGELEAVAQVFGWHLPVILASESLRARGWPVPVPGLPPDNPVDQAYWASRSPTAQGPAIHRRTLLAARLLAHGAHSVPR